MKKVLSRELLIVKLGRFELADKSTLFLDEISELPLNTQAKLLQVLQDRHFERVGGTRTIACDVRIIAATNQDLRLLVNEHSFRADLYYRLNIFPLHVPPLARAAGGYRAAAWKHSFAGHVPACRNRRRA